MPVYVNVRSLSGFSEVENREQLADFVSHYRKGSKISGIDWMSCGEELAFRIPCLPSAQTLSVIQGTLSLAWKDGQATVKPGDLILLPAYCTPLEWKMTPRRGSRFLSMLTEIPSREIGDVQKRLVVAVKNRMSFEDLHFMRCSVIQTLDFASHGYNAVRQLNDCRMRLLCALYQMEESHPWFSPSDYVVEQLCAKILADPSVGKNLTVLSNSLSMSERSIRRHLDDVGIRFRDLKAGLQLWHGLVTILEYDCTIEEIAKYSGFAFGSRFRRCFRDAFGISADKISSIRDSTGPEMVLSSDGIA